MTRHEHLDHLRYIVRNQVIGTQSNPVTGPPSPFIDPDRERHERERRDAYYKAVHIANGLSDPARREVFDRIEDRYYWSEQQLEAIKKLEGDELRDHLTAALMNYHYPGTI